MKWDRPLCKQVGVIFSLSKSHVVISEITLGSRRGITHFGLAPLLVLVADCCVFTSLPCVCAAEGRGRGAAAGNHATSPC